MDLVSLGIGGKTLDEARESLAHSELLLWLQKQQRDGPLNMGLRIDRGFALIAFMIYSALPTKGPRKTMADFMPPWYQQNPTAESGLSFDDVMKALGGK